MADFVNPFDTPAAAPTGSSDGGFVNPFDNTPPPVPAAALPVAAQHGALGQIGSSFARGALVDLPTLIGQAGQFAGINNNLAANAAERGKSSWLTPDADTLHNGITNALASGAEQIPTIAGAVGATVGGAALAGTLGAPALVGAGVGALAGALPFAGQAGEQTLEAAKAKGVSSEAATSASRLNYLATLGTQVGLGMVGGKVISAAGGAFNKLIGSEAAPLANQVLDQLTGTNPFAGAAKAAVASTAEITGLNAANAGASAAINQQYGISDETPLDAIKDSVVPSLGLAAVLTPLGLAGRALNARAARTRTSALASESTPPEARHALADQYAAAIAEDGTPASVAAAKTFRENATTAIDANQPLNEITPEMFTRGAVTALGETAPGEAGSQLPIPGGVLPVPQTPEGTLPTNVPVDRDLLGNPTSLVPPTVEPNDAQDRQAGLPFNAPTDLLGPVPEQPPVQNDLFGEGAAATPGIEGLSGDDLFAAADAADAAAARRLPVPVGTPEAAPRAIVVNGEGQAATPEQVRALVDLQRQREALGNDLGRAGKQNPPELVPEAQPPGPPRLENNPTPITVDAAGNARTPGLQPDVNEIAARDRAANPPEPEPRLPNETKTTADIRSDISDVNAQLGTKDIPQTVQPVQKVLDSLKIDSLPDHQAQIDALDAKLADPNAKIGNATRDRLQALSDKWKADLGQTATEDNARTTPEASGEVAKPALPAATEEATRPANQAEAEALKGAAVDQQGAPIELPKTQAEAVAAKQALAGEGPAEIKGLSTNIPDGSPDTRGQPPAAKAITDTLKPNTGPAPLRDRIDQARAELQGKAARGETLSALEQERLEDLNSLPKVLDEIARNPKKYTGEYGEGYVKDMMQYAETAAKGPYKRTQRNLYKVASPEDLDPRIVQPGYRLIDTLNHIVENGSSPEVKAYAQRLADLNLPTSIANALHRPGSEGVAGTYDPNLLQGHINIFPEGSNEWTILHEATHAATEAALTRAERGLPPRTELEARQLKAYKDLEAIRQAAQKVDVQGHYGLTDVHEFVSELYTNKQFQDFLKAANASGKSLWSRVVDAVKSMLGIKGKGDFLEQAMKASDPLFDRPNMEQVGGFPLPAQSEQARTFNKTVKGAAETTDAQYEKMPGLLEKALKGLDFKNANRQTLRAALPWQTVQYIADRTRAVPEFVKSGLAKAVDHYYATHTTHRMAQEAIEHPITKFAQNVQAIMTKLGDGAKARELSRLMATIGGEASRGQFDYRMNYADNVKAGRQLPPENKAYVDDIHRQFAQLQRTNPEAAKAIEQGELLNKKVLTTITSSLSTNLLDASAGVARRLQAELNTLRPDDARRAELQNQVNAANAEAAMYTKHSAGLDYMAKDVMNAPHTDKAKFSDGSSQVLDSRLGALFKDADTLPAGSQLRASLNELRDMYYAQSAHPYFSLGRDGDYFVKVGFKDGIDQATADRMQAALKGTNKVLGNLVGGEDHAFFRVKTLDEASGLLAKMRNAAGDKIDESKTARGLLADKDYASATGVSAALRGMIDTLHQAVETNGVSDEAAAAIRQTLTRQVLSMLPETSSRSAKMSRAGVPGYDADFLGNYARRATGGIRDTANIYTQRQFSSALKGMSDAVAQMSRSGTLDGQVRGQMIANEINTRYSNSQKSVDNSVVNTINSLGHTFFLAASPAYIIRTMAQPFHRALPLLGSRYGFVNSATEIGKATGVAVKVMARTIKEGYKDNGLRGVLDANSNFKGMGLKPEEEAFLQELHDRGILNLGQSRQLQSMALGGTQRQQDITRMASMTAQYAEMTNRMATALAAFRLAQKGTKGVDQAGTERNTEYAIDVTKKAMDDFEQSNTARAIGKHGIIGTHTPLVTAFMNYNLQTMQQIARTVHDGLFNQDQSPAGLQRSKEAKREFAGLMATTFMISGALGLPFANAAAGVWNTFTNDNDDPKDIRMSAQKYLEDTLGGTVGGAISHGLPHALGVDTSTFGLENLLPGSDFLASRQLLKDRLSDQSMALMGPALNGAIGIGQAIDKFSEGHYVKGIEAALPSGLKPYFKAAELAERGYTNANGDPINLPVTPWGIGLQAVGFNTAARATQEENATFNAAREARQEFRKQQISDRFYQDVVRGADPSGDVDALSTYNIKNPTQPIGSDLVEGITNKYTDYALAGVSGTGVGLSKRQYPAAIQNLLQANPNAAMP
jgi:hypothetical protein